MTARRVGAALAVVLCLLSLAGRVRADTPGATLFRVFLQDGTSLVSYGEVARVGDRVVFSMPTSAATASPQLQLVNIPADRVDWNRTSKYAESARATDYLATQASADYALVSSDVAEALNQVGHADDPVRRLAIVEKARKTLAEWPAQHFNYRQDEVRQILPLLDEAIADLRARTGGDRFNLTFVANVGPPLALEPMLPPPTPKEAIEQTLTAARLTDSPAERVSLLTVALGGLMRDADVLPADWLGATIDATRSAIDAEMATDRVYRSLSTRMLRAADQRARAADVRGLQRLIADIHAEDARLGGKRNDVVSSLVDSVEAQLDAARRLQLERDHWRLRLADFRTYWTAVDGPLGRLNAVKPALENIKALAGTGPEQIALVLSETKIAATALARVMPPEEFVSAHALLVSAVQLAESAARTRREAALTGNLPRAWDASAAAAGALMLADRARTDIQSLLRLPQLPKSSQ